MMSDVVVRQGVQNDLSTCAQIINDWIDATHWMPRIAPAQEIAANFEPSLLEKRYFLVAEIEGKVAGYLSADAQESHIHGFYVADGFRNCGAGTALMDETKKTFPQGLQLWTHQPNTGAQKFYERHGFQEVRRTSGDNPENLPDILYRWKSNWKPVDMSA